MSRIIELGADPVGGVVRFDPDPNGLADAAIDFAQRREDPPLDRVIDSTRRQIPRPKMPEQTAAVKRVLAKVADSPAARAVARRLALAGVGAAAGGYIG